MVVEDQDLPVRTSIGRRTMTASQLNMSWTVAPANARRKSPTSVIWPMETSVFVTEVPMLAPITIGIACLTSKTEKNRWTIYWDYTSIFELRVDHESLRGFRRFWLWLYSSSLTIGCYHADDNGRAGWWTLNQNRRQDPDHHATDWITQKFVVTEHLSSRPT